MREFFSCEFNEYWMEVSSYMKRKEDKHGALLKKKNDDERTTEDSTNNVLLHVINIKI